MFSLDLGQTAKVSFGLARLALTAWLLIFLNLYQASAAPPGDLPERFVAIEAAAAVVTILDGGTLAPLHRFEFRAEIQGPPAFTRDGRYAVMATADGWVAKFDLVNFYISSEVRAGVATRGIALSGDGRYVAVANETPSTLVLLNANDLGALKTIPVDSGGGIRVLRVAPPRQSFIAVPAGIAELWEISYSDNPPHRGWVHDYRDDGVPTQRPRFPVRRMEQKSDFRDIIFDESYEHVLAASTRTEMLHVVDLYIGRRVAEIALPGRPQLGASARWRHGTMPVLAIPNLAVRGIDLIDANAWQTVERIATLGAVGFLGSHPNARHAWAVRGDEPNGDTLHLIDKTTLAVAHTLRPEPGWPISQIAFDRHGRRAIVSVGAMLVVYDTATLNELRRVAMPGPTAVYTVGDRTAAQ